MTVTIRPTRLSGSVEAPPSKSIAHRYLIAAALAEGTSRIEGISSSEDISATIDCLTALGARIEVADGIATVTGIDPGVVKPSGRLLCRESGSTLRFLLPLGWIVPAEVTFEGKGRLPERPLSVYDEIAKHEGLGLLRSQNTVSTSGRLAGGEYTVPGDISSQFITGLLFALPFTGRDSVIHLLPPVESRSYLDLTLAALSRFGSHARFLDDLTIAVPAEGRLHATDCRVEGDASNAAFFAALTAIGHSVAVTGLSPDSLQGDRVFREHFAALKEGFGRISLADCPDLGPILMAVAAALHGAHFTDTRRLAIKESDRGAAMAEELSKLGIRVTRGDNEITVHPGQLCPPQVPLSGHNDHRIVMACATLLTLVGGSITGAEAVKKSLPEYFELLGALGAEIETN